MSGSSNLREREGEQESGGGRGGGGRRERGEKSSGRPDQFLN